MRQRGASSSEQGFPIFPISPILEYYGGEPAAEGYGWRAYRCPFHGDRNASGSVNTEKQVYNCHAAECPKGSAVQIIMQWEKVDFGRAVERAEEISGEGNPGVRRESGRRSRMAGGARSRSGVRAFKRTWRSS